MQQSDYIKDPNTYPEIWTLPFFTDFNDTAKKILLSVSRIRSFEHDETITKQGDFDPWVYFLIEGTITVIVNQESVAEIAEHGAVFGEMVLIDESDRSATLISTSATRCLAIDAVLLEEFEEQEKAYFLSDLYRLFAKVMAIRLREADDEISILKKEINHIR